MHTASDLLAKIWLRNVKNLRVQAEPGPKDADFRQRADQRHSDYVLYKANPGMSWDVSNVRRQWALVSINYDCHDFFLT